MWIIETNVCGITYWLQERNDTVQLTFIKENVTVYETIEKARQAIQFFKHKFFTELEVVNNRQK